MNLWIILAITWISISVVIADQGWFVQDNPLTGEDNDDPLSSEHLLIVKPKSKQTPNSATTLKISKEQHPNGAEKANVKKINPPTPVKSTPKPDLHEVISEGLIPVHATVRKPLAVNEKKAETVATLVQKNASDKKPLATVKYPETNEWFVKDLSLIGDEDDEPFSSEHLLLVKPKTQPKPVPKPVSPSKPVPKSPAGNPPSEISTQDRATGRKPLAVVQKPPVKTKTAENQASSSFVEDDEIPCENDKDIDCLMETENLILVNDKKKPSKTPPKVDTKPLIKQETVKREDEKKAESIKKTAEEVQKASLHRRLLDNDKTSHPLQGKPILQPLIYEPKEDEDEIDVEEEDDLLETERQEDQDILRRLRRQATEDTGSGGGAAFIEEEPPTESPVYIIPMVNVFDVTNTSLTAEEIAAFGRSFAAQINDLFSSNPAYQGLGIKNISLDENNRLTVEWDLVLSLAGATGDTTPERKQNLLDFLGNAVVPAVNNIEVFNYTTYGPARLDNETIVAIASAKINDICQAENACPNGYACVESGTATVCRHKCYSTGLIDQCQNGGACQLDTSYNAYCQCGTGYTGSLCEEATSDTSTYSTTQIAGAGVAGGIAALGILGSVLYMLIFRRKKEDDMEYSYFGEDDSGNADFSENSVGRMFFHIDRPEISFAPIDL